MFHVITGGSGSGKSAYAESCITQYAHSDCESQRLFYIATMEPYGGETMKKIEQHRRFRAGKGFRTIECYTDLAGMIRQRDHQREESLKGASVLLECMSNLVANELYHDVSKANSSDKGSQIAGEIVDGIVLLCSTCEHVVVVTNEVCAECADDSEEMVRYKQVLSEVNRRMARIADLVTEIVYGIPLHHKRMNKMIVGSSKNDQKGDTKMRMIIGGAYQGQIDWAKEHYPDASWVDGKDCPVESVFTCEGIFNFHEYIRRVMEMESSLQDKLAKEIMRKNPNLIIVTDEIGCGLVPVDAFMRNYREKAGRICTELAAFSVQVVRVNLGIGTIIKGENKL